MEEVLIKPETAVLAKQKGFNWHCQCYYKRNESLFNRSIEQDFDNWNGSSYASDVISAPTQSLLQKYLREEHKILLTVEYSLSENKWFYYLYKQKFNSYIYFETYEEALEEGLLKALTFIK